MGRKGETRTKDGKEREELEEEEWEELAFAGCLLQKFLRALMVNAARMWSHTKSLWLLAYPVLDLV